MKHSYAEWQEKGYVEFLAYLRGIETFKTSSGSKRGLPFLAYLRGIETILSEKKKQHPGCVFSLPKRD
ncbi:hypothetical protein TTE2656 [Caldanaerobacter subterraneus subsp. tengcongensis MB4]|uniref:Uncharacterized protein n=1 Tax=Caldanaerobacter subterraneus subsp. tengcongensis (strain DSM 15242 / JCM 11007 / NBRC 100824 / MB4) TaxID=273068 RepID=Q8R6X7_CALS4|nr:hypothetical protein TTE2656 [Caldanaerobacter subterraneus subsp. tengcongensis MB4]